MSQIPRPSHEPLEQPEETSPQASSELETKDQQKVRPDGRPYRGWPYHRSGPDKGKRRYPNTKPKVVARRAAQEAAAATPAAAAPQVEVAEGDEPVVAPRPRNTHRDRVDQSLPDRLRGRQRQQDAEPTRRDVPKPSAPPAGPSVKDVDPLADSVPPTNPLTPKS